MQTKIHVFFLTPFYYQNRGNSTTAKRLQAGMEKANVDFEVYAYEEERYSKQVEEKMLSADIVHILHFHRFFLWLQRHSLPLADNVILSSGGTDVNKHLFKNNGATDIEWLLRHAKRLTVFTKDGHDKLSKQFPDLKDKIEIIPQSAWLPNFVKTSETFLDRAGGPHFLLPAGLRKVKDVFYLIPALQTLKSSFPGLTFSIVGAAMNPAILQELQKLMEKHHWIEYLGEVTLEEMASLYKQADFVLNTSVSEGQPQTVLEAMLSHRPVLARRNPGNESIIEDGVNGYLFSSPQEFLEKAKLLLQQDHLRRKITKTAFSHVQKHFSLAREIKSYLSIYYETSAQTPR